MLIARETNLWEALSIEGIKLLVLKGLADLHHPVGPEIEQHHLPAQSSQFLHSAEPH
jgi:hypothetical protein